MKTAKMNQTHSGFGQMASMKVLSQKMLATLMSAILVVSLTPLPSLAIGSEGTAGVAADQAIDPTQSSTEGLSVNAQSAPATTVTEDNAVVPEDNGAVPEDNAAAPEDNGAAVDNNGVVPNNNSSLTQSEELPSATFDNGAQAPSSEASDPQPEITPLNEGGISPQAANTLTATVSNGTTTSSTAAVVDTADLYTLTIDFDSEVAAGREVVIDIPKGLRLVSGTGIASVGNNVYTKQNYTPSEQLIFDGFPTWQADGTVPAVRTIYSKSGTLTYPIQAGANGGTITLQFRPESYLYDFSGDQTLDNLTVAFAGTKKELTVQLKSIDNNTVVSALTGTASGFLDYAFPLTAAAGENYPFLNPNNLQQDYIRSLSFDLTYMTGAVIGSTTAGWTLGTVTDNGNGTSTVHVIGPTTGTAATPNIWTDGRTTNFWTGSVSYPASAGFAEGNAYDTTMSNFSWETVGLQSDGSYATVVHSSAQSPKTTQTIKEEGEWAPTFAAASQQKNWETKNGYDDAQVNWLFRSAMMANGFRSFTPVRFRFDADPLDNVTYLTIPTTAQGNVTKVVYKYKGEAETVWNSTDAGTMPGVISYISSGDQWGIAWRFTAAADKAIEYAYVEYDHDEGILVGGGNQRRYGANVVVGGRPVNDAYTGVFSHHVFSTWQNSEVDGSGTWTQKTSSDVASDTTDHQKFIANGNAGNDHGGFRWSPPDPFLLTEKATDKTSVQSFDDTTKVDGYYRTLAEFTLTNASGNSTVDPMRVDFDLDTENDNVTSITFPYSYNADADEAAKQVTSLTWTYTDGTTGSWTATSGQPMPFTPTTTGGVLEAPDGKFFETLSVLLDGWNASTTAVVADVTGRPVDDYNYTDRSQHTMTVTQVSGTETELCSGTAGYVWSQLPANSQLAPSATSVTVNAGSSGLLSFEVQPATGYYSHSTFAIVLPSVVTPAARAFTQDQAGWTGAKPINWSNQQGNGATLVGSRPATATEIAQANANTTVDMMPADSMIYFYQLDNQAATYYRRTQGRYAHLGIQLPITVSPVAGDQVYSFQQIASFGTNLDDGRYSLAAQSGTTAVASENLNVDENGVSDKVIRPISGTTLTINKDPALVVEESIASSDGVFKTYVSGDDDSIAHFVRDETGTIKLVISNTVESTGIDDGNGYVFINIPKAASTTPTMVVDHEFDFTLTDEAEITSGEENFLSSEIRYLTSSDLPLALGASDLFDSGSTTFNPDATMVAIKLEWLNFDKSAEIQIPIKAPSIVSDTVIYNQWQARSVFVFKGSSIAVRDNGEKSGYLRADFQHPDWTLTFDSQGGSAVAPDTVEDAATIYDYDGTDPRSTWNEPTGPTWPGKVFGGWFTDAACTAGNEFDFTQTPTADMTAYAKWTENTYTVSYDTTGGTPASIDDKTNVKWSDANLLPAANPTRAGFRFNGWNTAANGTGTPATSASTYSVLSGTDKPEITLYAQWVELPDVTINYQSNDVATGSVSLDTETVSPATGTASSSTASPAAGYSFVKWTKASDTAWESASATLSDADLKNNGAVYLAETYTAHFSANTDTAYVVKYWQQKLDGTGYDEVTASSTNKTGTTNTAPTYEEKTYTGFTFDRVSHTSTGVTETTGAGTIAGDGSLVVNVYYNRNAHDVTFDAKGHGTAPAAQTSVKFGAFVDEPADPTAAGWTFGGWYKDSECTPGQEWVFNTETMPDSDITLYASWTRNQYKVNFLNDGPHASEAVIDGDEEQTVDYEGFADNACTVTITSTPVSDYEVIGWSYDYKAADGTQKKGVAPGATGYTSVPILGNVTFHAVIYKVPFVSAAATHGKVSIAETLEAAPTPTNATAAMEGLAYLSLPVSAGVKFAPDSENYELSSIVAKDFESTPHKIELKKSDNTLVSDTYPLNTVDKEGEPVTIYVTLDLTNGTISTNDAIGISFEFDVIFEPIQTTYTVEHYRAGVDGNYPTTPTDTDTMPSASTTIAAGSAITFTPKNYTGTSYDSTLTTYQDSATAAQEAPTTVKFDGSSVVKLYYPRNAFDMTFDVQGIGTAPDPATDVYYEAKVPAPTNPTAPGYAFEGWFKDADCTAGQEWDFDTDTMPNADTTVYAKWTELPAATINYVVGTDSDGMGSVTKATESVAPATGTVQGSTANAAVGYHFVNWTHDVSGVATEVGTNATYVPAKNADDIYEADTYAAHFAPNTDTPYEVHYFQQNTGDNNYTEVAADKLDKTGTTAAAIDNTVLNKTYTGFSQDHVGYKDSANSESATVLSISADGSLVVNVYYTRNTHDVIYNANGHGTDPASDADVRFGATITPPTAPTALGYDFGGWYTDAACTTANEWNFTSGTMPNADLPLYAKWTEKADVTISYASADAAMGSVDPASEPLAPATGTAAGSVATPNAGYHFVNWTVGDTTTVAGSDAALTQAQVDAVAKATGIYAATTFTANFAPDTDTAYQVRHFLQEIDGSYPTEPADTDDMTGTTGELTAAQAKTYEGFTAGTVTQQDIAGDGSTVVSIEYTRNSYTLSFDSQGGSAVTSQTVKYADTATEPAAPTRAGYVFDGWYTEEAYLTEWNFATDTMPADDVVLYAKWTELPDVTITYTDDGHGSTTPTSENVAPATGVASGSVATADPGYHFVNWTVGDTTTVAGSDATLTQAQVDAVAKASGIYVATTFKANFAEDANVTITYVADSHSSVDPTSEPLAPATGVAAGSAATPNTGYHFVNWTVGDTTTVAGSDATLTQAQVDAVAKATGIYAATTFKANSAANAYKITFNKNEGTGTMDDQSMTYDESADLDECAFTRPGFTFAGWATTSDGDVAYADKASVTNLTDENGGTVELFAIWTEDSNVVISYTSADAAMGSVDPASEPLAPALGTAAGSTATAAPGYYFVNWTVGDTTTVAGSDATLTQAQVDAVAKATGIYVATTFTANFVAYKPAVDNPPVSKMYAGDKTGDATFTFTMTAKGNTAGLANNPMPDNASGQSKSMTLTGEGSAEFGIITFTLPGTYTYEVTEQNDAQSNWIYSSNVYTVRYEVTQVGNELVSERIITGTDGVTVQEASFTNTYMAPKDPTKPVASTTKTTRMPQTGDPLFFVMCGILVAVIVAGGVALYAYRRRKR